MTGYDQSPEYSGAKPTWRGTLFLMVLVAVIAGGFLLASLGKSKSQEPKQGEQRRWVIVPATNSPVTNQGSPFIFAWRLDTQTGALEMCTYDPGGWPNPVTKGDRNRDFELHPGKYPQVDYFSFLACCWGFALAIFRSAS